MPITETHQTTGTAADHMKYIKRDPTSTSDEMSGFSRAPMGSDEWSVHVTGGKTYKIKFDKNFSKKHLFTFTKKTDKITAAVAGKQTAGSKLSVDDLTKEAHEEALLAKMTKNVNNRANTSTCGHCGHDRKKHQTGSGNPVDCKECAVPKCTSFETTYGMQRQVKGVDNGLAGAATQINTCIVLNIVPKGEFDKAVSEGIKNAHVHGSDYLITLNFGAQRVGAIKQIDSKNHTPPKVTDYKSCQVHGKKTSTDDKVENWEIFHMETSPTSLS